MGPKTWYVLGKPSDLKPGFTIASGIYPKLCLFQFTRDIAVFFGVAKRKDSGPSCGLFRVYGAICSARIEKLSGNDCLSNVLLIHMRRIDQFFNSDERTDDDPSCRLPVSRVAFHVQRVWGPQGGKLIILSPTEDEQCFHMQTIVKSSWLHDMCSRLFQCSLVYQERHDVVDQQQEARELDKRT